MILGMLQRLLSETKAVHKVFIEIIDIPDKWPSNVAFQFQI
jgi:hypothetical protein